VVRDHRSDRGWNRGSDRNYRDNNRGYRRDRVVVRRQPVYVNNGRFVFHGGYTRTYSRPVIRHRYYDVRYRPQIVVENYDPVPGYIWVQGRWNWDGYEWQWVSGYYAVDTSYQDEYYDDGYYNSDGYYNNDY